MTEHSIPEAAMLARFSIEEFSRMVGAGVFAEHARMELHDGVLVEMNAEYLPHARIKFRLATVLDKALDGVLWTDLEVLTDVSVAVSERVSTTPDISVWSRDDSEKLLPGTRALLVVEVSATTLATDLGYKKRRYAECGIAEYWVVDVDARCVHQHSDPQDGIYETVAIMAFGSRIASASVPGLSADLNF